MPWSQAAFGWSAIVTTIAAYVGAFVTPYPWLGILGAVVSAPFCIWVTGYPLFSWAGWVAVAANLMSAHLLLRGRRDIAFAALVPFMVLVTALAVFALRGMTLVRG